MKKMVQSAVKRKKQSYADLVFIISHSVMNERWEEVYNAMLGEKKKEEDRFEKLKKIFSSIPGMKNG